MPVLNEAAEHRRHPGGPCQPLRAGATRSSWSMAAAATARAALAAPLADRVLTGPARPGAADERRRGRGAGRACCCSCMPTPTCRRALAPLIRPTPCGTRLGALRCAHRRPALDAAAGGRAHEPALAPDRHRHRRPGDLRAARRLRRRGRLPRPAADGRHRALAGASSAWRRRPACASAVVTSGRRWEAHGVWRTILLMWRLRFDYWRGVPPQVLAEAYR